MQMTLDCVPCLVRQALEAGRMAGGRPDGQERLVRRALLFLAEVGYEQTPVHVTDRLHALIREETGVEDPYRDAKERSNALGRRMAARLGRAVAEASDPFEAALRLAIAGNVIDYGAGVDENGIEAAVSSALQQLLVGSPVDDLRRAVDGAADILYLADNAGELFLDRLLIERLPADRVTLAVRGGPILNDATRADAEAAGLHELVTVVDNGSRAPGTVLERCSPSFRERFARADLIIAKGQGNFESLSSVAAPVFFLLKVKCSVLARHLGCRIGDLVVHGPG